MKGANITERSGQAHATSESASLRFCVHEYVIQAQRVLTERHAEALPPILDITLDSVSKYGDGRMHAGVDAGDSLPICLRQCVVPIRKALAERRAETLPSIPVVAMNSVVVVEDVATNSSSVIGDAAVCVPCSSREG